MAVIASCSSARALPELPVDVNNKQRWILVVVVMLMHVVVAGVVIASARQPVRLLEAAPISVTLLTQSATGELVPSSLPSPKDVEPILDQSRFQSERSIPLTPAVAAVAAPVQSNDMVVPVAQSVSDTKRVAVDSPAVVVATVATVVASSPATMQANNASSAKPVQVSHTAIQYLNRVEPKYPKASEDFGEHGTVLLHIEVNERGIAETVEVIQSSGYPRLDVAARKAAIQSTYVPYTLNGVPQKIFTNAPFAFNR